MKVLLLTKEYPPNVYGGAGVHVEYLSRELAGRMEVEVRCFGDQTESRGNLIVRGFTHEENHFGCSQPLRAVFDATRRCLDFNSRGIDADVVHCHTWYTLMGGILAKLNYGLPLVVTAHSLEPLRPWKREQLAGGYDYSLWLEKTAMEMADAVIAVSEEMKRDILYFYNLPEERVRIIHNGIDTDEYRPRESIGALLRYGIDPGRPYLLFVGRITRQKGIVHLVRAVEHMDPGFQVVLCAGAPDTPEIAREMKESVARVSAKRKGVIWIEEMVDRKSVIELYSHAAAFCCPSVYEPFGIINLEAMACETPVVASDVGGIPEIVVEGETGFLVSQEKSAPSSFEPKDPARFSRDLASRVNLLMGDPGLRRRMGAAGRKRALEFFSWAVIAGKTLDLYEQLARERVLQER